MTTESLRLGNFVRIKDQYSDTATLAVTLVVSQIHELAIGAYRLGCPEHEVFYNVRSFEGIVLTSEWLMRLGFVSNGSSEYEFIKAFGGDLKRDYVAIILDGSLSEKEFGVIIEQEASHPKDKRKDTSQCITHNISCVHELQNLWNVLSEGKELILMDDIWKKQGKSDIEFSL